MAHVDFGYLLDNPLWEVIADGCKKLQVGDKVRFQSERNAYTVKAKSERFIICTKPFNLRKTVLYTILDLKRFIRGRNDRVFNPYDYTKQDDIDECLKDLVEEKISVSHRHCVVIDALV